MIETTNPEIDVDELTERVRLHAEQAALAPAEGELSRARGVRSLLRALRPIPDAPTLTLPAAANWDQHGMDALLQKTRSKIFVPSWIPRIFRRLFQRQSGFNRGLLETVGVMAGIIEQLSQRVEQLSTAVGAQNEWLQILAQRRLADAAWMTAIQERIIHLADLQMELERHGEHLRNLQAQIEQNGKQLRHPQSTDEKKTPE